MGKEIAQGMKEICENLADYSEKKGNKKQGKEFRDRAKIFKCLGSGNKPKELKQMGKRLTPREKEERVVEKIVNRIKNIEKDYSVSLARRACYRYYNQRGNELKLKREIKEREKELESLKKKAK